MKSLFFFFSNITGIPMQVYTSYLYVTVIIFFKYTGPGKRDIHPTLKSVLSVERERGHTKHVSKQK